ncbi:MFS transporter [Streptomyces tricolor]|nr:MFS transporter [Streptomyces tricolor]
MVLAITRSPGSRRSHCCPRGWPGSVCCPPLNAAVQQRLPGWVRGGARRLSGGVRGRTGVDRTGVGSAGRRAGADRHSADRRRAAGRRRAERAPMAAAQRGGGSTRVPPTTGRFRPWCSTPGRRTARSSVSVTYRIAPENWAAFTGRMRHVARSRHRTGALTWGLFQDGGDPDRFIENYVVASWAEHLAQHHSRLTAGDRRHEEQARALLVAGTTPEVTHAFYAAAGPVVTAGSGTRSGSGRTTRRAAEREDVSDAEGRRREGPLGERGRRRAPTPATPSPGERHAGRGPHRSRPAGRPPAAAPPDCGTADPYPRARTGHKQGADGQNTPPAGSRVPHVPAASRSPPAASAGEAVPCTDHDTPKGVLPCPVPPSRPSSSCTARSPTPPATPRWSRG